MPKRLLYIKRNGGFILPYVLFLTTLILLILTASIRLYHNEVHITQMELEAIKMETLFQRGYTSFIEDSELNAPDNAQYEFPDGNVKIEYVKDKQSIRMKVTTDQESSRSFSVPLDGENVQSYDLLHESK